MVPGRGLSAATRWREKGRWLGGVWRRLSKASTQADSDGVTVDPAHPGAAAAAVNDDYDNLPLSFADICRAHARVKDGVRLTSCYRSTLLSELCHANVYLKAELQQQTGSFKERGARNALMCLDDHQRQAGVIAASAGNHALALAAHGTQLDVPVTVVMPNIAPMAKVGRCTDLGATVVMHGDTIADARDEVACRPEWASMTYINGYDDPAVLAGAGTIGLEIADQVPQLDCVVIPCGGGGLLAGVGLAVKTLRPNCRVYSVEAENCPSFAAALKAGKPVHAETLPTLADGLAVPTVGTNAFAVAHRVTDLNVTVSELEVARAVLRCVELEKLTVEGGGAAGLAAILPGGALHEAIAGKTVAVPLCGGNIDVTVLGRVLDRGLAADGRLVRVMVKVSDRPGGIKTLSALIADEGGSIKDIYHARAWLRSAIDQVQVQCVLEVTSASHGAQVRAVLEQVYGKDSVVWTSPLDDINC